MEGRVRSKVNRWIKEEGCFIIPLVLGQNWPDESVYGPDDSNNRAAFVEFKSIATKGKLSDGQILTIERLQTCGYETLVVNEDITRQDVKNFLKRNLG